MWYSIANRTRRGGYTLVEVLVVCGIISILAALALPSVTRSIQNARRTKCASNLRQIGIAFNAFAHEHGDRYPQQTPIADGGAQEQSLDVPVLNGQFILSPLAFQRASAGFKSAQVMVCPATRHWVSSFAALNVTNLSYALNLFAEPGSANVALVVDSHLLGDWRRMLEIQVDRKKLQTSFDPSRHDGRGNVLYGDGHVESRSAVQATPAVLASAVQFVEAARRHSTNRAGAREFVAPPLPSPAPAAPVPALLVTETQVRRSLLWLWLLLATIGLLLILWHFRRERQRQVERDQQRLEKALERQREQARRMSSRPGGV